MLILLALGGALALGGPDGAAPATPDAATQADAGLGPSELARITVAATPAVARGVERVRGLEFRRLPEPEVVTSGYLNRLGARELKREGGGLGLAADGAVGQITGLLEPEEDLRAAYRSTGDLAAAAYDPRTERLYVVSDAVAPNRTLIEFVLAHELDHALEDQRFGLRAEDRPSDDGALAAQALAEGSATAVMTEFAARYLDAFELLSAAGAIDPGADDVPDVLLEQLTWTYTGGQRFVTALRELAGSWKLVDYALSERPPATTEQVLHPRKYVTDERPAPVRIDSALLRRRDLTLADRNVFGELTTSYLLEVGADAAQASAAAAGWDGDRYELWRGDAAPGACADPCRSDLVLVASWSFDTDADASEFARAVPAYLRDGLGAEPRGRRAWSVDGGYVAVAAAGRDTALVFAPEPTLAHRAATAQVGG